MAGDQEGETEYSYTFREDEEMEFYTELALHEVERWIQAVTKKTVQHPDDTRKSLENGVLLCELLNCLQPGSVGRINRLPTPIAGLDNVHVFLQACKAKFGLSDVHLFNPSDLEDLSQRAIAESAHLTHEYEKRLRNVAITIYWLGRYANRHYQGAQLDLSAFAALIHHRQESDGAEQNNHTERTYTTGAPSSNSSEDRSSKTSNTTFGRPFAMDSPNESLEETASDVYSNMSSNYYNTSLAPKSQDQFHISREQSHITHSGIPGSHRRYSSTDSLESSHCSGQSGHSRQGSEHQEAIYPTRRLSSQLSRKQSVNNDPLQFIKSKGAQNLAHTAEVQMRVASESKKGSILTQDSEENVDWQANLSSWKNRRKSQSERSFQSREDLEQNEKQEDVSPVNRNKTFSQMQEERQHRMTSRQKFYPIQDDDTLQYLTGDKQHENNLDLLPKLEDQTDSSHVVCPDDSEVTKRNTSQNMYGTYSDGQGDTNNNYNSALKSHVSVHGRKPVSYGDGTVSSARKDVYENGMRHRNSEDVSTSMFGEMSGRNQHTTTEDDLQLANTNKNEALFPNTDTDFASKRQLSNDQVKEAWTEKKSNQVQAVGPITFNRNVGSRTQTKIGSILQNLEDSSNPKSLPKLGYSEKVDLSARRSMFENAHGATFRNVESYVSEEDMQTNTANESPLPDAPQSADSVIAEPPTTSIKSTRHSPQEASSTKHIDQGYVRKTVTINQRPNSERGFGFVLSGGSGKQSALYISKVVLGSAADVCELKAGDVVTSINQTDVTVMTAMEVGDIVSRSVDAGNIEVQILRQMTEDDSEDFISSEEEEEEEEDEKSFSSQNYRALQKQEIQPVQARDSTGESDFQLKFQHKTTEPASSSGEHKVSSNYSDSHMKMDGQVGYEPPAILRKWQQQHTSDIERDNSDIYSAINLRELLPQQKDLLPQQKELLPQQKELLPLQEQLLPQQKELLPQQDSPVLIKDHSVSQEKSIGTSQSWRGHVTESAVQQEVQAELKGKDNAKLLEERRAERRARILQSTALASSSPTQSMLQEKSEENQKPIAPWSFVAKTTTSPGSSQQLLPSGFQRVDLIVDARNNKQELEEIPPGDVQPKHNYQPNQDVEAFAPFQEERERILVEKLMKIKEETRKAEEELRSREEQEKKRLQEEEEQLQKQKELLRLEREKFLQEKEEFKRFQEQLLKQQLQEIAGEQPYQIRASDNLNQQSLTRNFDPKGFQPISQQVRKQAAFLNSGSHNSQSQQSEQHKHTSIFQPIPVRTSSRLEPAPSQTTNLPVHPSNRLEPALSQTTNLPVHPSSRLEPSFSQTTNLPVHHSSRLEPSFSQTTNLPVHPSSRLTPEHSQKKNITSELFSQPQSEVFRYSGNQTATRNEIQTARRDDVQIVTVGDNKPFTRGDTKPVTRGDTKPFTRGDTKPVTIGDFQELNSPIIREAPTKEEIHSLNSVPKARFRSDADWQSSESLHKSVSPHQPRENTYKPPLLQNKAGNKLFLTGPGDHWLIQEAERRRVAELDGKLQSGKSVGSRQPINGPIKPAGDSPNRWQGHTAFTHNRIPSTGKIKSAVSTPAVVPQTKLQQTASIYGSHDHGSHSLLHTPDFSYEDNTFGQTNFPCEDNSYGQAQTSQVPSQQSHQQQWQYSPHLESLNKHTSEGSSINAPTGQSKMPVTGSQLCSHCDQELGYGAAMVIESLSLFFHVQCFRCWVCYASLGAGDHGADVRVRINKLHCPNCYSNDEAGLKFSKV